MGHADAMMLAKTIEGLCGPASAWPIPDDYGYPRGLALCVIDSIQSTGVKYGTVQAVVTRYRDYRGPNAATDGALELLRTFEDLGDRDWLATIGNHNRTYARAHAPLKSLVIRQAATMLASQGVNGTAEFRARSGDTALRSLWTALPSQGSAITWHYAHMLAGTPGVKPDRMIRRFVAKALGVKHGTLSDEDLIAVVTEAATELGSTPTATDHIIWLHQSGRLRRHP